MDKNLLRNILKEKRNKIKYIKRIKNSKKIFNNFKKLVIPFLNSIKNTMIYLSFGSEVITKNIINFLFLQNKNIYVPAILNNNIVPVKLEKKTKFKKGKYGILEPIKKQKIKNLKDLDIVVVPGIAFDKNGNRIGFGKGYFDKFLKKINKKTLKIGLAFSIQLVKKIPANKNDIKMDYIITEKEIIKCK